MSEPLEPLVVTGLFPLPGVGIVLQPGLPVDAFAPDTPLTVSWTASDGTPHTATGRFVVEHLNLGPRGSVWDGVIVLASGSPVPEVRATVVVRPSA